MKARKNAEKHGVTFEEAASVFSDEEGLLIEESVSLDGEARLILLGISAGLRFLVVVHTVRGQEDTIRIISARKATRTERYQYQERLRK